MLMEKEKDTKNTRQWEATVNTRVNTGGWSRRCLVMRAVKGLVVGHSCNLQKHACGMMPDLSILPAIALFTACIGDIFSSMLRCVNLHAECVLSMIGPFICTCSSRNGGPAGSNSHTHK
jgi:hypothetical protein